MVGELLVEYIDDGRKLLELLDVDDKFKVTAALWYYFSESSEWRLLIGSPYVGKRGKKKSFDLIQSIMRSSLPDSKLSLDKITPMNSSDPFLKLLKGFIKYEGICGIRVTNSKVNDLLIEDSYIYRNV